MYATLERLIARFTEKELVRITDQVEPFTGQINMVLLDSAMQMANSEIDAHLSTRYSTPIQNPNPFLQGLACDLTRYHVAVAAARVTDRDEKRYDAVLKILSKIGKGEISIGVSPAGAAPAAAKGHSVVVQSGRPADFGRGGW